MFLLVPRVLQTIFGAGVYRFAQKLSQDVEDNLPFIITFTSGTTGSQKAIYHKASSFIDCAGQFNVVSQISKMIVF